jgi:O-antigen/teichoic acid export membrane protein
MFSNMLNKLKIRFIGNGGMRAELSRGAIGSLTVKLGSTLLGLVLAVILARNLGPEGYGIYAYVFALVSLIAIPAQLGLPALVVRETAKAQVYAQWGMMRGLWRWSAFAVGGISVLLAFVALLLSELFSERFSSTQLTTFAFGIVLIPLVALGNLRGAALRGLRRVIQGQLSESVLRPGILILLVLAAVIYLAPARLSPAHVMGLNAVAATVSFIIGAILLWRARPGELAATPRPEYASRAWLTAAIPLALIAGMQLINKNTDIIMLGLFRSAEEVGVYKVVVTGAMLVAFGLQAVTMAISPHFARIYSQNDMERLQRLVTLSARAILLFSLPVVLILVFFGDVVLVRVFGKEYVSGQLPLAILAVGQLVNAAMGSVGMLLTMTGHEWETARAVVIAAIVNVILNLTFIPPFGMTGAAVATAITLIVWNLLMWWAVRQRLGIESMAFRIFPAKAIK